MDGMSLVRVLTAYSGVVEANIEDIWQLVKVWCPSLWIFSIKGTPCSFHVLEGDSGEQVGAVRATVIGNAVVVEKLVSVDAEKHSMAWKCITDPRATNPFPGSFVNYYNELKFTSMNNGQTYADWSGELWTDPDSQDVMRDLLSEFYQDALESLEKQIQKARQPRITHEHRDLPKDPVTMRSLRATFGNSFR